MRLIDADELITAFPCGETVRTECVRETIKHMPTIEERKTGKWIVTSEFDDCCYVKCNQCNVTQIFYYGKPFTNYCPNCGAKMDEGSEKG